MYISASVDAALKSAPSLLPPNPLCCLILNLKLKKGGPQGYNIWYLDTLKINLDYKKINLVLINMFIIKALESKVVLKY